MVMDLYESLLQEASKALAIEGLKADENNTCLIKMPGEDLSIQLEIDKSSEHFILGAELGFAPPGRYRENLLFAALKANRLPYPNIGTFAFSKRGDQLVLVETLPLKDLNGERIAAAFTPFAQKASQWRKAILQGDPPPETGVLTGRRAGSGIFGL